MILGRVAYRGSFNLKSAVTIAGSPVSIVSSPPSISLVTFNLVPSTTSNLEAKVALIRRYLLAASREVQRAFDRCGWNHRQWLACLE